jgi:hypothetical protein
MEIIETEATLWRWQGSTSAGAWHFLTIAGEAADAVRLAAMTGQWLDGPRGFGSIRVLARIGDTSWATSVFPDRASGDWILPVKKAIRLAEGIDTGASVRIILQL